MYQKKHSTIMKTRQKLNKKRQGDDNDGWSGISLAGCTAGTSWKSITVTSPMEMAQMIMI